MFGWCKNGKVAPQQQQEASNADAEAEHFDPRGARGTLHLRRDLNAPPTHAELSRSSANGRSLSRMRSVTSRTHLVRLAMEDGLRESDKKERNGSESGVEPQKKSGVLQHRARGEIV